MEEWTTEKATVLIVDDERGPRESLRMILTPNHRVIQAQSGAEALEILGTEAVDLVTLDLNMPGMKGQDLMHTIRSEYPEVEIIIITGCGSLESAADGIRSGICDYLQKPFDVVQVSASVTRALSRHRARTRLSSFLRELGGVVGRDRDAHAILDDVYRSQKMKGRLGGLLE
ncbi:MAG: response regulator, partial [Deltaproteobacteria bacterium]|nr:response regulator [Deltaproteobacteria bacterium]